MAGIRIDKINGHNQASSKKSQMEWFSNLMKKDFHFGSNELGDKQKSNFYNDLHILLSSGIDLRSTLELMCEEASKQEIKDLYISIKDSVLNGSGLSDAVEKTGRFSAYECYSIRIGEETGCLNAVLKDLVGYFTKRIEQKRKIKSAFSYPIFVFAIAIIAVAFMMVAVVPMFQDVFARFGNDLPYLTKLVIDISNFITDNIMVLLIGIAIFIAAIFILRKNEKFMRLESQLILRLPFFGELIRKMYLARFSLAMALLSSAHIPMLQALNLIKKMIPFYPIRSSLETVGNDIMKGKNLYESLEQFKIYDKRMVSLIKVGEEVNKLDMVFERLKNQYMEDIDYQTNMISSILEPLMIIFVGIFVGIILISMYLPIFQLSTSIGY